MNIGNIVTSLFEVIGGISIIYFILREIFNWRRSHIELNKLTTIINEEFSLKIKENKADVIIKSFKRLLQSKEDLCKYGDKINRFLDDLFKLKNKSLFIYRMMKNYMDQIILKRQMSLSVEEFYQFWTDLFINDKPIFLRATSRIDPEAWFQPEFQLYLKMQVQTLEKLQSSNQDVMKKQILKILKQIGISETKINKILYDTNKKLNFYERIFIFDPYIKKSENKMKKLSKIVELQVKEHIRIGLLNLLANERTTPWRPQDFGLIITENGNFITMYLDLDENGNPIGAYITINNKKEFQNYVSHYIAIMDKALFINKDDIKNLISIIDNLEETDIANIYGNRCYYCLLDAERKINSGTWETETSARRHWYEIVKEEQDFLYKIIPDLISKFHRDTGSSRFIDIAEIGTGPGRIINLLLRLKNEGTAIGNIIGFEQDRNIEEKVTKRFEKQAIIYPSYVGFKGNNLIGLVEHEERFGIVLAISNLVGWQCIPKKYNDKDQTLWVCREVDWISYVLSSIKPYGFLVFTVYKRDDLVKLKRARMYRASGDIVEFIKVNGSEEIGLYADVFRGEIHISKSYSVDELNNIINKVRGEWKPKGYHIIGYNKNINGYRPKADGIYELEYMYAVILQKIPITINY